MYSWLHFPLNQADVLCVVWLFIVLCFLLLLQVNKCTKCGSGGKQWTWVLFQEKVGFKML